MGVIQFTKYNIFNTIIRIFIGVAALIFVFYHLKDNFNEGNVKPHLSSNAIPLLVFSFLLSFLNWGIEALKWKYLIREVTSISFFRALGLIFTGITVGILTPNRVAEIPVRAYLLNERESRNTLIFLSFIGSVFQMIVTYIVGIIGLIFIFDERFYSTKHVVIILLGAIVLMTIFIVLYFKHLKINLLKKYNINNPLKFVQQKWLGASLYSLFRYFIFAIQLWIILKAFEIHINQINFIWLIPIFFLISSSIPTILLSEIGVRSSVGIFVFGTISENDINILAATIVLWIINIALPAFLGLYGLKEIKLFKNSIT